MKEISAKFIESYNNSKNTISIKRHGALKTMIKEAVSGWQGIEKKPLSKFSNDDRKGHDYDHYYDKYFGDNKDKKEDSDDEKEKEEEDEYYVGESLFLIFLRLLIGIRSNLFSSQSWDWKMLAS